MRAWFILLILLAGCMQLPQPQVITPEPTTLQTPINAEPTPANVLVEDIPIKRVKVGDLVSFPNLNARDPDGDDIEYIFSYPLNKEGYWRTGPGDEGEYNTTIVITDGETESRQKVRIIVETKNAPPEIENVKDIKVFEGEVINLSARVIDPDGDKVNVKYVGWRTQFPYKTKHTDAGVHVVTIVANDGVNTVERAVTITVEEVNRPPVIHMFREVSVIEGDLIEVIPDAEDPDGDKLEFTFYPPLNSTGGWQTKEGDVGFYESNVTVSDGTFKDTTPLRIHVNSFNAKPIVQSLPDLTVKEGDTIDVTVEVEDPEGELISIKFSGWMDSHVKETTHQDAGIHLVTVSVSDGTHEVNESFQVIVENINRPPTFGPGSFD